MSKPKQEESNWLVCVTCGWKPEKDDKWPQGKPVIHCEGSSLAYVCVVTEPHHATQVHAPCWNCGKPMGCAVCVPGELLCRSCIVWTRKIEFLRHGPFSNDAISIDQRKGMVAPGADSYPFDWKVDYRDLFPNLTDDQLRASVDAQIRHMHGNRVMPREMTGRELQRERNSQVAALSAEIAR